MSLRSVWDGSAVRVRLKALPAGELEQVGIRVYFMSMMVIFAIVIGFWNRALAQIAVLAGIATAIHAAHLLARPQQQRVRLLAGIVLDQSAIVAFVAFGGMNAAPIMAVSAMASLGYALRFGATYAVLGGIVAFVGLSCVVAFVPEYRSQHPMMVAVIGFATMTPIYAAFIRSRLDKERVAAETTAQQFAFDAQHDTLTGLANRKTLIAALSRSLLEAEGRGRVVAVLFIDLDGFKQVNDTLGHAGGDAVLSVAARCLQASTRDDDLVARVGGDEFVVLAKGFNAVDDVATMALHLESSLGAAMAAQDGVASKVAASVGIATYSGGATLPSAESLLNDADAAMYRMKSIRRQYVAAKQT